VSYMLFLARYYFLLDRSTLQIAVDTYNRRLQNILQDFSWDNPICLKLLGTASCMCYSTEGSGLGSS